VNGKGNKDHKDMDIGAVLKYEGDEGSQAPSSSDSVVWSLQSELGRRSAEGDWDAVHALSGALYILGKGKGKGKGPGKGPGKGFPKGAYGKSGGKGAETRGYDGYKGKGKGYDGGKGGDARTFDGYCNYC
jgi:hypothetical protein